MDTRTLIRNLNTIFRNQRQEGGKYTQVWLSRMVSLGFYKSKKFVLNVHTEHEIDSLRGEVRAVFNLLKEKGTTELQSIMMVDIHHFEDGYRCQGDDLPVYEDVDY